MMRAIKLHYHLAETQTSVQTHLCSKIAGEKLEKKWENFRKKHWKELVERKIQGKNVEKLPRLTWTWRSVYLAGVGTARLVESCTSSGHCRTCGNRIVTYPPPPSCTVLYWLRSTYIHTCLCCCFFWFEIVRPLSHMWYYSILTYPPPHPYPVMYWLRFTYVVLPYFVSFQFGICTSQKRFRDWDPTAKLYHAELIYIEGSFFSS